MTAPRLVFTPAATHYAHADPLPYGSEVTFADTHNARHDGIRQRRGRAVVLCNVPGGLDWLAAADLSVVTR